LWKLNTAKRETGGSETRKQGNNDTIKTKEQNKRKHQKKRKREKK
jgi:hypothetical protein